MGEEVDENNEEAMQKWLGSLPPRARECYARIISPMTAEDDSRWLQRYKEHVNPKQELIGCGCCGKRWFTSHTDRDFPLVPLSELGVLKVPAKEVHDRMGLAEYAMVYSMYKSAAWDGEYYYLHPELVEREYSEGDDLRGEKAGEVVRERVRVCADCLSKLDKKQVPAMSVVGDGDMGLASRLPFLPKLSAPEEMIVALVRPFMMVYKLGTAKSEDCKQEGLVGHAISFTQDVTYKLPNRGKLMRQVPMDVSGCGP